MTQKEYLELFKASCEQMFNITSAKNKDYAGSDDAFKNFRSIETFTSGNISVEEGIVVRMTDKFQRMVNLLNREAVVADEKIDDTILDLAVYAIILRIYLRSKNETTV